MVNKDFLKNGPRQKIFEKIFGKLQDSTWSWKDTHEIILNHRLKNHFIFQCVFNPSDDIKEQA